jgi:hypothetical protein
MAIKKINIGEFMLKNKILTILSITSTFFVCNSWAMDDDMEQRKQIVGMQIEYHGLLNAINGRNDENFSQAIKNTNKGTMEEYFGNHITKKDFYELNQQANGSKHDWKDNPWNN